MATTQYIGPRYVPVFADPIDWTSDRAYEPLTIVLHDGNSYTTKQYTPKGINISDTRYWALTGNYNAQMDAYRNEVKTFDDRITANTTSNTTQDAQLAGMSNSGLKTLIDENTTSISTLKNGIAYTDASNENVVIFSDSTFQTNPDPNNDNAIQKSVVTFMQEMMQKTTVVNFGVGGTSISYVQSKLSSLSTTEAAQLTAAKYVIIAYGTNEWQGSNEPIRVNSASTDTFDYLVEDVVSTMQSKAPHASIVLVTPAYVHSTQASTSKTLNINNCGCNFHVYGDVMQQIAAKYNVSCLRLDNLMGITETNYKSRMVTSGNDIWVHYNEETNRRIARLLCSWMYGSNAPSVTGKCVDVTPMAWKSRTIATQYYNAGTLNRQKDTDLSASSLIPNRRYWVTLIGGAANVFNHGSIVAVSDSWQGVMQFPVNADSNGSIALTFTSNDNIFNVRLTTERPYIYDGMGDVRAFNSVHTSDDNYGVRFGTNSFCCMHVVVSDVSLTDSITEVADMSSVLEGGPWMVFGYTYGSAIIGFLGRVTNGKLYWNKATNDSTYSGINIEAIAIKVNA